MSFDAIQFCTPFLYGLDMFGWLMAMIGCVASLRFLFKAWRAVGKWQREMRRSSE